MGYFSSGGSGTSNHAQLANRNAADQHPMTAITGLAGALAGKAETGHAHAATPPTGKFLRDDGTWAEATGGSTRRAGFAP